MSRLRLCAMCAVVAAASGAGAFEQPGQCATPLTDSAITDLVAGGVPPARLRQLIASCGIDLGQADMAATELRLRQIGVAPAALTALSPPASAKIGDTWISPFDRRAMAFVPSGNFRMGSDAERDRDPDESAHDVAIENSFWMDVEEVTNDAFQRFLISRPEWQRSSVPAEFADANYLRGWSGLQYPDGAATASVTWVSWHAAHAYAAWTGKRLPTEAEWEYAARAGSSSRFWWGNDFDGTRVTGSARGDVSRRANPWGLRDITGGLWEWTATLYRPYPYRAGDGREDPRARAPRSTRGGSRINGEAFLRSANRNMEDSHRTSDLLGFRCVR